MADKELIFEPRAFWSVARLTPTAVNVPVQVQFPLADFRNGGRWPIVLEHMLIAPVGYLLEQYGVEPPTVAADRHTASSSIQFDRLFVTAPGRQHYSFRSLLTSAWSPVATADVSMRASPTLSYASGLFNVCRWNFSRPLDQPRGYGIEFEVGGILVQPAGIALGQDSDRPKVRLAFFEKGPGIFPNSARVFQPSIAIDRSGTAGNNFPFPPDGLGSSAGQGGTRAPYKLVANEFRKHQQSQMGREQLTGFSVAIDAIGYEDAIQAQAPAAIVGRPIAAEALRMPVSCRTMGGVTDTYWWRPGAPLALVMPTITPAQCYKLRRPITLHPGDVLDIQGEVPGGFLQGQTEIFPTYQFGVSFTGYAIIEG